MKYRNLGESGLRVSRVVLGSHQTFGTALGYEASRDCVRAAFEAGVNCFDTADTYGAGQAEELLGRALADLPRSEWTVATKCYFPVSAAATDRGLSRKHIVESVDRSLRRLRVEHIDLMQCHRFDPMTPLEETIDTMDGLVRQGKILYWGLGRFTASQLRESCRLALSRDRVRPIAHQLPYSLLRRDAEPTVLQVGVDLGLGNLTYAPLGQGVLSGKYSRGAPPAGSRGSRADLRRGMYDLNERSLDVAERLVKLARESGRTPSQLAVAWCLAHPAVTAVIVGATRPEQIRETADACEIELEQDLMQRMEAMRNGAPGVEA